MALTPSLDSRVRANKDVLYQELQGEAVLLNLKTGAYFGLDPVGTRIWQLLQGHDLVSDIAERIREEFDVSEERCTEDLLNLVAEMESSGLVSVSARAESDK